MTTLSKDDVLRIAGEPVRWLLDNGEDALCFEIKAQAEHYASRWGLVVQPLHTEAKLLAMYAAGAEDMQQQAKSVCNQLEDDYLGHRIFEGCDMTQAAAACGLCTSLIAALPITPANTER